MICVMNNNIENVDNNYTIIYNKEDIMNLFKCESDKALRILKLMYSMCEANKIGREYYVTQESLLNFLRDMQGREIII
jgi:hypothetical protein